MAPVEFLNIGSDLSGIEISFELTIILKENHSATP
jgi:hypothetical protein